jgi:GT2 family glycosyltransferase
MILYNKKKLYRYLPQSIVNISIDEEHKLLLKQKPLEELIKPISIPKIPLFVFVVLQYNSGQVTLDCIRSIDDLESEKILKKVVVVDNCSSDDSASLVKTFIGDRDDIMLLVTSENKGFAQGNNFGYVYAKKNFSPNFIILINNDIVFPQKNILSKILKIYNKTSFSILGPDIIVHSDKGYVHQNPHGHYLKNREDTLKYINNLKDRLANLNRIKLSPPSINGSRFKDHYKRIGPIVLHGSAYIFSPQFINRCNKPFDERTFLYGEEAILALRAYHNGHKIVYTPKLKVFHHTKASTDTKDLTGFYKKRLTYSIESAQVYLSVLESIEKGAL